MVKGDVMETWTETIFSPAVQMRITQSRLCTLRHHRRIIDGLGSVYADLYVKLYYMVKDIDQITREKE